MTGRKAATSVQSGMLDTAAAISGKPGAFNPTVPMGRRQAAGGLRMSSVEPESTSPNRPRAHQRSLTEAYGRLPLRVRTSSHPELRALVEDYERASLSPESVPTVLRRGGREPPRSATYAQVVATSATKDDGMDVDGEEAGETATDDDEEAFAMFATPPRKKR